MNLEDIKWQCWFCISPLDGSTGSVPFASAINNTDIALVFGVYLRGCFFVCNNV